MPYGNRRVYHIVALERWEIEYSVDWGLGKEVVSKVYLGIFLKGVLFRSNLYIMMNAGLNELFSFIVPLEIMGIEKRDKSFFLGIRKCCRILLGMSSVQ